MHICFYLGNDEVININNVVSLEFLSECVDVNCGEFGHYFMYYFKFDRIEVDKL